MRLIDADALKRDICKYCNDVYSDDPCEPSDCEHMRIIDSQPTIDAVEVVHGRWVKKTEDCFWYYACSECGNPVPISQWGNDLFSSYCPNCGARMDGGMEG